MYHDKDTIDFSWVKVQEYNKMLCDAIKPVGEFYQSLLKLRNVNELQCNLDLTMS